MQIQESYVFDGTLCIISYFIFFKFDVIVDIWTLFWVKTVFYWVEKENMEKLCLANFAKLHKLYKAEKKTDRKKNNFTLTFTQNWKVYQHFAIHRSISFLNIYENSY